MQYGLANLHMQCIYSFHRMLCVNLEVNLEDKQIKNKMKLPPEFSETIQKHDFTESTNKLNELPNKFKTLPSEFFEGSDSIAWSNKIKSKKVFSHFNNQIT